MIKTIEILNESTEALLIELDPRDTIVVHSGTFHAHDVFASLFYDDVIRTRNERVITFCKQRNFMVVDVGLGDMDHHAWKGYHGLKTMFPETGVLKYMDTDSSILLESVARIDCGEEAIDYVSSSISSFNPCWNEKSSSEEYDKAFMKARMFAEMTFENAHLFIELKKREIARNNGAIEAASIVDQAMLESAGSSLLVLPRFVPWQEKVCHYNELAHVDGKFSFKWVLFPSPDGTYRVQAVPKSADSMEFHVPCMAQQSDAGFVFCHPNKFICGYATKDDAVKAVRSW